MGLIDLMNYITNYIKRLANTQKYRFSFGWGNLILAIGTSNISILHIAATLNLSLRIKLHK